MGTRGNDWMGSVLGIMQHARPLLNEGLKAVAAASDTPPKLTVETINNHVYFYADVDTDRCLALIRSIRDIDGWLRNEHTSRSLPADFPLQPIWLHINSGGGDLFTGFATADQLQHIKTPIFTVIEGLCASAATLIALAGTRRYILENSFVLIHQLSSFMWGKHDEFQDELKIQEMAMNRLVAFYVSRTNLKEKAVRTLLTRETWMDSALAIENGFVDDLWKPSEVGGA